MNDLGGLLEQEWVQELTVKGSTMLRLGNYLSFSFSLSFSLRFFS